VSHLNAPRQRWLDGRYDRKDARDWPDLNTPRSAPPARNASPSAPSFQVTLRGPLCDMVRAIVGECDPAEDSRDTVLTDLRLTDRELRQLVGRADALGLEIVQVRRLTGR
jgi:hypothetical protein